MQELKEFNQRRYRNSNFNEKFYFLKNWNPAEYQKDDHPKILGKFLKFGYDYAEDLIEKLKTIEVDGKEKVISELEERLLEWNERRKVSAKLFERGLNLYEVKKIIGELDGDRLTYYDMTKIFDRLTGKQIEWNEVEKIIRETTKNKLEWSEIEKTFGELKMMEEKWSKKDSVRNFLTEMGLTLDEVRKIIADLTERDLDRMWNKN